MSMSDWASLGSLLGNKANAAPVPKASYGSDAPVKFKGPSPGMIGPPAARTKPAAAAQKRQADPSAIWDAEEVGDEPDEIDDGRPQPEYDIVFKQNVSPEDMFLGIDPMRHAGVSCSDALLVKIKLPGCKLADLDLDVRSTFVRLQAPGYKLKAWLPERVDETRGKAQWDKEREMLTVTLPVVSSLDSKVHISVSDVLD